MFKRITIFIMLSIVMSLLLSCASSINIEDIPLWQRGVPIYKVVKKSGETIEFSELEPGQIKGDVIVGVAKVKKEGKIELMLNEISEIIYYPNGMIDEIWTVDGKLIFVGQVRREKNVFPTRTARIP